MKSIKSMYLKLKKIDKSLAVRALACGLVFSVVCAVAGFDARCNEIRDSVLRLHILANSDTQVDQELKLYVRDEVLKVSGTVFGGCENEAEAAVSAKQNISLLTETAQNAVYEKGFSYPVTVTVAESWFDNRTYDDFTLPAGNYEAVKIVIGEGEGHNWWCVMFPAVCLPAAAKNTNNTDISSVLSENESEIVKSPKKYFAAFKVVEIYEQAKNSLSDFFAK